MNRENCSVFGRVNGKYAEASMQGCVCDTQRAIIRPFSVNLYMHT